MRIEVGFCNLYTHNSRQIGFHDQLHLFNGSSLNKANRWDTLAGIIPLGRVENEYRRHFIGRCGEVDKPARLALDCLTVKDQMQLPDVDTMDLICENPYIQYFLGYAGYHHELSPDDYFLTNFR